MNYNPDLEAGRHKFLIWILAWTSWGMTAMKSLGPSKVLHMFNPRKLRQGDLWVQDHPGTKQGMFLSVCCKEHPVNEHTIKCGAQVTWDWSLGAVHCFSSLFHKPRLQSRMMSYQGWKEALFKKWVSLEPSPWVSQVPRVTEQLEEGPASSLSFNICLEPTLCREMGGVTHTQPLPN